MSTTLLRRATMLLAVIMWAATGSLACQATDDTLEIATFDDLYLEPGSYWHGNPADTDNSNGTFVSGSFEFNNYYMADWGAWAWFGYAACEGTHFSSYQDDMVCAAGSGHDSSNYGVAYMSDYYGSTLMSVTNTTGSLTIPGLWLTNTQWVKTAVLEGDGMSDEFSKGDYCAVKITGIKEDGTDTDPIEIRLADYTSDDEADWYVLDTWQWHSLEELGAVKQLRWEFTSTKRNYMGITTPAYACLDDLGASCPVRELAAVSVHDDERAIDLSDLFSFTNDDGNITYTLLSGDATIVEDKAVVTAPALESTTLVICATQRGKREWVSLPVDVAMSAISTVNATDVLGYSIYNSQGILLHEGSSIPSLPAGIYIMVRHTSAGNVSKVVRCK